MRRSVVMIFRGDVAGNVPSNISPQPTRRPIFFAKGTVARRKGRFSTVAPISFWPAFNRAPRSMRIGPLLRNPDQLVSGKAQRLCLIDQLHADLVRQGLVT